MKFLVEYIPSATGPSLPIEHQFDLARVEFGRLGATVSLVQLDPHYVAPGLDSPFAVRPYSTDAVVVEIPNLSVLCRYVADTGRTLNLMAGSSWESINQGELLTHKLFVFVDGYGDREDCEAPGGCN